MTKTPDLKKAQNKYLGIEFFVKKGIISIDLNTDTATINYLLWHSFSAKGAYKLCASILFYLNLKRAYEELSEIQSFRIVIDYMNKENDYKKTGEKEIGYYFTGQIQYNLDYEI
jgi:hypothetical protein